MMENLNSRIFSEHLHSIFRSAVPNSNPLSLELIEVTEKDLSPQVEQFSVVFRCEDAQANAFPQGIHALEHDKLGKLELFLVPIGRDAKGLRYEAVFNRMRKQNS